MVLWGRMGLVLALVSCVGVRIAVASGDDSCSPTWSLARDERDKCSSVPFLSPANDSRVNLRLLLADDGIFAFIVGPASEDDVRMGYGSVPFDMRHLDGDPAAQESGAVAAQESAGSDPLAPLLARLGMTEPTAPAPSFASGDATRCQSNHRETAAAFVEQVLAADLPDAERRELVRSRLAFLRDCTWSAEEHAALAPHDLGSALGKHFGTYLNGALSFYEGGFADARTSFTSVAGSAHPWLRETARYMLGRSELNAAQQSAFDENGYPALEKADRTALASAEKAFDAYLAEYPKGRYAASARGLRRRIEWLSSDAKRLSAEYARLLRDSAGPSKSDLVDEIDDKLLVAGKGGEIADPELLAVVDLMQMRRGEAPGLALPLADLEAQKPVFAKRPELHRFLLAADALYVAKDPSKAIAALGTPDPKAKLDSVGFSAEVLRGLALEASGDRAAAEALWSSLFPRARAPLQRPTLELALAWNLERSGKLDAVFAKGSLIQEPEIRAVLLRNVASAERLRMQTKASDAPERECDTALFVLLYKDLLYGGGYQAFVDDSARLPDAGPSKEFQSGGFRSEDLALFRWSGQDTEEGYQCPGIRATAQRLVKSPDDPHAVNCLGEFILRAGLDSFWLEVRPRADELGGTKPPFGGTVYSRLDGYEKVIANPKQAGNDQAYALYRAIRCFAPSGYNGCGSQDVPKERRKEWFHTLHTRYAKTPWAERATYYW